MRVLVATALALLAMMMMSRSCVADPDPDQAPEATIDPPFPEPENKIPVELEDNGDFDLSNMAQGHDQHESVDQLTKVDAEVADSSTFQPANFASNCRHKSYNSNCTSIIKFYAMGRMYSMTVSVVVHYNSYYNRVYFAIYFNRSCIGYVYASASEDAVQKFLKKYLNGVTFDIVLTASNMYNDLNRSGTQSCWNVQIKASNKVWATTKESCRVFYY